MVSDTGISKNLGKNQLFLAALKYAERGLSVIPLQPKGKKPLIEWTAYQVRRATREEIVSWWSEQPRANIGVITGKVSGIVVLDVDTGGFETLRTKGWHLPPTAIVKTGKGWHYYYKHPGFSCHNFARRVGEKELPGIDLRGDGGYVVAPPSIHSSGVIYTWSVDIRDTEPVEPPDWLAALIREDSQGATGRRLAPEDWVRTLTEGERNTELTRRAGRLLAIGIPEKEVRTMLAAWNKKHCSPPLPEKELSSIIQSIGRKERRKEGAATETPYYIRDGCIYWRKESRDGNTDVLLSNFTARIVRDVVRDDGAMQARIYEITGQLASGEALPRLSVPADKFLLMNWLGGFGSKTIVSAGPNKKDHLRAAIQNLSHDVVQEYVFTHIGWRQLNGKWVYLHTGGAIGAKNVLVAPDIDTLKRYTLTPGNVRTGIEASLRLLEVAPLEMVIPIWSAVWRAPTACLLYPTLTLWLYGSTGSFKSTLAALFLSHYGSFDKDNLPASWSSTDNALERTCFLCRDAVLVVDDYVPEHHRYEAAALERRANRLVRQIGNRQARGRLTPDLRSRPEFIPNCLLVANGEQLPLEIPSVAARILPVQFQKECINLELLTAAQKQAAVLPYAMHGYLSWLAAQMDTLAKTLPERFLELRCKATVAGHARLPETVAHLHLGTELATEFMADVGAIDQVDAECLRAQSWNVFMQLAREHKKLLEEERPSVRFLRILDAIFATGAGVLRHRWDGSTGEFGTSQFAPLLGWYDEDFLYLIPEAAWRAVNEYLRASGGFPLRERTLRDLLAKERILERGKEEITRAIRIEGQRVQRVLCLHRRTYTSLLGKEDPLYAEAEPVTTN